MMLIDTLLMCVYASALGVWGYEDMKIYRIRILTIIPFTILFAMFYALVFASNPYAQAAFLFVGLVLMLGVWIALRKQLAPFDHFIIALGLIAFPYLAMPAFILSQVFLKLLLTFGKTKAHAYVALYFASFLIVVGLYLVAF